MGLFGFAAEDWDVERDGVGLILGGYYMKLYVDSSPVADEAWQMVFGCSQNEAFGNTAGKSDMNTTGVSGPWIPLGVCGIPTHLLMASSCG